MNRTSIAVLMLTLLLPTGSMAQEISKDNESVLVRLGNDVYRAGNVVQSTETVVDDLIVAGNVVTIEGDVGGDVHAAASNLTINGDIADDVRVAAGNVIVTGTIGGDLLLAGGTAILAPSAVIRGNLLAAGGSVRGEGTVLGNVRIAAENIAWVGETEGSIDLRGETVRMEGETGGDATFAARSIVMDPAAVIAGSLTYWSSKGEELFDANIGGEQLFDASLQRAMHSEKRESGGSVLATIMGIMSLISLLAACLSIGLFQLATKTLFEESAQRLRMQPGMSLLIGAIYFLMTPIVALFLAVTIIGIPLALALVAFYGVCFLFANVVTAMIVARWAQRQWAPKKKQWHPGLLFLATVGIWIVMKALWIVPVVGWLVLLVTAWAAWGAALSVAWAKFRKVA